MEGFSSCGSKALEHRLSSCGAWAQVLHGMWDPPGLVIEPVPPALAGGFLTTEQSGKPKPFALGLVHFMDFDKCMIYIHRDHTEQFSSVQSVSQFSQFSRSVVSDSLRPHGLQLHCAKNPLVSASPHLLLPDTLQPLIFTVFIVLPFPESHMVCSLFKLTST